MAYDSSRHFSILQQNTSTNTHRAVRNDIRVANNTMKAKDSFDNAMAVTSTNVFVYSNGCMVGMIQSFTVSENRGINKLQALGWEGVVNAVPNNTDGGTLNISRIALYESQIWNALGLTTNGIPFNEVGHKTYPAKVENDQWDVPNHANDNDGHMTKTRYIFKTLKDQKVPLEIQSKIRRDGSEDLYFTETYIDVWIQSFSKSYSVGSITVAEQVACSYADVY